MTASSWGLNDRPVLLRAADGIENILERHFWLCGCVLGTIILALGVRHDLKARMWIDELYTLYVARQANAAQIIEATLEGCDGAPPLYALIVHATLPWLRNEALAVRLPSTLGFCGMAFCLLAFCRRRMSALYCFVAVLAVCDAGLYYATEGRSYGVVACGAAGALLCWQSAAEGRRRMVAIPLLALCLALMTALHYYSILFLLPLVLGEFTRWRNSEKRDVTVWAALAAAPLVLGLHLPLINAARRFQEHFWMRASWANMHDLLFYIRPLAVLGVWVALLWLPPDTASRPRGLTLPEWVTTSALLLTPFCALALSIYTTHIFVDRYVFWALPGIAILAAALLCVAARGRSAVGVTALGILVGLVAYGESMNLSREPVLREGEAALRALSSLQDDSEPIVVANHHVFMELSYYAPVRIRKRLIYPVNRDLDLYYMNFDTGALLMSALSHRSTLRIIDYDTVIAAHPRFALAAMPGDYLPFHLVQAGRNVKPILRVVTEGVPSNQRTLFAVYEVTVPAGNSVSIPRSWQDPIR